MRQKRRLEFSARWLLGWIADGIAAGLGFAWRCYVRLFDTLLIRSGWWPQSLHLGVGSLVRTWGGVLLDYGGAIYNAKHPAFGAVGDGVTDDTTALTDLIATAGPAFMPKGTYLISSKLLLTTGKKLSGAGNELTTILCDDCDGIGFTSASANDGRIELHDFRIQHISNAGVNTNKGLDFTDVNYAFVRNVDVQFHRYGLYMTRSVAGKGCFYDTFENFRALNTKYGVYMDDDTADASPNEHKFLFPFYESTGTFDDGIAYYVTGYGHLFLKPVGAGMSGLGTEGEFMHFGEGATPGASVAGNILVINPYIEGAKKYGFRIPTTNQGRYGIYIIAPHFDGEPTTARYSDPANEMTILDENGWDLDARGLISTIVGVLGAEPSLRFESSAGGGKDWRWYAGGGGAFGAGQAVLRNETDGRSVIVALSGAAADALTLTADGAVARRLGVRAAGTATASALPGVSKVAQIFDESGNSLGYVPIYPSFTP